MSEKHSLANKKQWAKIPPEERSRIMRERVVTRWKKTSKADRLKIAEKLVKARRLKRKKQKVKADHL